MRHGCFTRYGITYSSQVCSTQFNARFIKSVANTRFSVTNLLIANSNLEVMSTKSLLSSNFTFVKGYFDHCLLKLKRKAKNFEKMLVFSFDWFAVDWKTNALRHKKGLL